MDCNPRRLASLDFISLPASNGCAPIFNESTERRGQHSVMSLRQQVIRRQLEEMVGTTGFEPATSPTPRVRDTRLRYVPTENNAKWALLLYQAITCVREASRKRAKCLAGPATSSGSRAAPRPQQPLRPSNRRQHQPRLSSRHLHSARANAAARQRS
jgi:hypothetical protein